MTPAMLEKARANVESIGLGTSSFARAIQGYMEELPIDDATADVVISNGVINLSPDKDRVFRESPGSSSPVVGSRSPTSSWHGQCRTRRRRTSISGPVELAGALLEAEMKAITEAVGLVDVEFSPQRWDTFSDAPSASSVEAFGTQGVAFRATKPRA